MLLLFFPRDVAQITNPLQGGLTPLLFPGTQQVTLPRGTQPDAIDFWIVADCSRVELCSAVRAKSLLTNISTLSGLHIYLWNTTIELEIFTGNINDGAKGRAGKYLAVRTMADGNILGVDIGDIADIAAMTGALNLHPAQLPV